jgi:diguanylate cyclase (GGDEF)-like protein/PAS domain S-box-containing protein
MAPSAPADRSRIQPAVGAVHELLPHLQIRNLVDQVPAILYVSEAGTDGRWHYVSRGAEAILGFAREEWMADPGLWARQVHPDDRRRVFEREDELAAPSAPDEYRMLHRDGTTVWVRDEAALVRDANGRACWHGVISDITDRKLAEAELERRAEQQAAVAHLGKHALEGASVAELMNEALLEATRITGAQAAAVLEHDEARTVRAAVGPWRQSDEGVAGQIDSRDGRWGELRLASSQKSPLGRADEDFVQALANVLAEAIRQRATEDGIRYLSVHDPLTGLPNRVLFLERLADTLSGRAGGVAVALLDIDNFKLINDSLGHAAGDDLLTKIAPRLNSALRSQDLVARFGGDEFVVLLERVGDEASAARLAERVVAAFESPFALRAGEHFAKVSVGIALGDAADCTPAGLIRDADVALYRAKERGRGRFEVFDHMMRTRTVERLSLENELRRALERGQLHVAYQPVVSLSDGSIRALEALLRWEHPDRGTVSPAEFIPVAEECGMIDAIGQWVLHSSCSQVARWQAEHARYRALGVSVNLSVRQFRHRDLQSMVAGVLARTALAPSSLSLEITESVLLEEPDRCSETIKQIAAQGVRFILDDFGTGYSSLAYLGSLRIDGLKVDRSFVEMLGTDRRSSAITTAIVRMAQALSIEVIAEGVENDRQVRLLRGLGCELAQGFFVSRPLSAAAIGTLLAGGGALTHVCSAPEAPAPAVGAEQ